MRISVKLLGVWTACCLLRFQRIHFFFVMVFPISTSHCLQPLPWVIYKLLSNSRNVSASQHTELILLPPALTMDGETDDHKALRGLWRVCVVGEGLGRERRNWTQDIETIPGKMALHRSGSIQVIAECQRVRRESGPCCHWGKGMFPVDPQRESTPPLQNVVKRLSANECLLGPLNGAHKPTCMPQVRSTRKRFPLPCI